MKKLMLIMPALAVLLISLTTTAPALADHDGWGHHGWGRYHGGLGGGWGGYRAYGWGWGHHHWCRPVGYGPGYGNGYAPYAPAYGGWGYPGRIGTAIRPWY